MPLPRPLLIVLLPLALAGCASPTAALPPPPTPAITVISPSTPLPGPTTPAPAGTATPAPPTLTPSPSVTLPCTNDSTFLGDLTVPDGTVFPPGAAIDKRWSVQNTGLCDWGRDYRLVHISGEALGAPAELALYPARSGGVATLQVLFTAPAEPGEYVSRWQARSPEGNPFGATVFIKIKVLQLTPTPAPP
ncbi:MAG: hypothetical protein HY784_03335 [Chloroflexi bacterium]|nr:hypothetical protein [Chloroflexota bacterium]